MVFQLSPAIANINKYSTVIMVTIGRMKIIILIPIINRVPNMKALDINIRIVFASSAII
jgi:hypothetical protein